ncbi:MAG: urea amidolyase associated protein UAAP1 [Rhizobacter sp.]
MQTNFNSLSPLARAAVPYRSTCYSPDLVLWEDTLPGGAHWSGLLRRGNTLRLTDIEGRANVSALFFNHEEKTERYNMPDTLKAQHTAHLTRGHALYSDMGRVLCSIPDDSCGWHDTVCGVMDADGTLRRYGEAAYQTHRNDMHRNGLDGFLVELGKWGLDRRDVVANVNFFSKVVADVAGRLRFDTAHRAPGQHVDVRFEMNVLVVLSAAPHPLDPATTYAPTPVRLTSWRSGTAGADDVCRLLCPENDRGYINTERWFL